MVRKVIYNGWFLCCHIIVFTACNIWVPRFIFHKLCWELSVECFMLKCVSFFAPFQASERDEH